MRTGKSSVIAKGIGMRLLSSAQSWDACQRSACAAIRLRCLSQAGGAMAAASPYRESRLFSIESVARSAVCATKSMRGSTRHSGRISGESLLAMPGKASSSGTRMSKVRSSLKVSMAKAASVASGSCGTGSLWGTKAWGAANKRENQAAASDCVSV